MFFFCGIQIKPSNAFAKNVTSELFSWLTVADWWYTRKWPISSWYDHGIVAVDVMYNAESENKFSAHFQNY